MKEYHFMCYVRTHTKEIRKGALNSALRLEGLQSFVYFVLVKGFRVEGANRQVRLFPHLCTSHEKSFLDDIFSCEKLFPSPLHGRTYFPTNCEKLGSTFMLFFL